MLVMTLHFISLAVSIFFFHYIFPSLKSIWNMMYPGKPIRPHVEFIN